MNTKNSLVSVANLISGLSEEELANTFFVPIADKDLPAKFKEITANWRKLATEHGYTGPVAWRVREGFTLKEHAPRAGKVYDDFRYLQEWKLQNDEPTKSASIFWIPELLVDSKSKNVDQQKALMAETRTRYALPEHHLSSFGSSALIVGLVLAHFKRTGERTPLNCEWARTDTPHEDGRRLCVGDFGEYGPFCSSWNDSSDNDLGVFAVGVELD